MFTPLTRYALAQHAGDHADWPVDTTLIVDGTPTPTRVPGYVVDAQYAWHTHALLITSWDCPFEEAYEFLLLDGSHRIVARQQLGAPYASWLLHAHWPIDDRTLRLHFHGHQFYTLTVREPTGLFRRAMSLRLAREDVQPADERSRSSIEGLDRTLEGIRTALDRGH